MLEEYRIEAVKAALSTSSAKNSLPFWTQTISKICNGQLSGKLLFDLGDHLKEIFDSSLDGKSRVGENSNSSVSAGGAAWESLVCWYLNLCLIGSRVVVIKSKKDLLPRFVADAITVKYNNFKSNTEADLIYIGFPEGCAWPEKTEPTFAEYIDRCSARICSLNEIGIGIVQTKTNWNDNSQIPMLWDMIYSAKGFGRNVSVGTKGRSISSFRSFSYSFVTVPTQKDIKKQFKVGSASVNRVRHLSGGNYWGMPAVNGIADSLNEFFGRNLIEFIPDFDLIGTLDKNIHCLNESHSCFGLTGYQINSGER